ARHWAAQGAKRLHIVDLNGAIAGRPKNEKVIRAIITAVGEQVPIQLGGGIRDLDAIESYLDAGVTYVVIGTAAVKNPGFLSDACYAFPGHVIAGLDAKEGKVAVEGWSKMTGHDVADLAKKYEEYGIEALIYTDIGRDGMMSGVNIEATLRLAQATKTPIIASGGLNSVEDIQAVCAKLVPEGVIGAIAARYDGEGADELAFLDITASSDERDILLHVIEAVAARVFIPLTVGGGVRKVEDVRRLLNAGADKVSINTAAVQNPDLVRDASGIVGAQCIVVAIDAKRSGERWQVYTHGGRKATGLDAVRWAQRMTAAGAGEVLLTSMDRDGTREGFDLGLTRAVSEAVSVPVIASGGVGNLEHLAQGALEGKADAVLAASIFHFGEYTVRQAKAHLKKRGIEIRE